MTMTQDSYLFLTTGKPYEEFEYCRNFGWCVGVDLSRRPVLTKKGVKVVKSYIEN